MALRDEELFDEPILAWAHGPVVESVYHHYKDYGSKGIEVIEDYDVTEEEDQVLRQVYNSFGAYSAWGLRNLTHGETPWLETDQNQEISKESMKKYFVENYLE